MLWFVLTAVLIAIDQFTKLMATQLNWSIFLNDQFAFSLPLPVELMFTIYTVVLLGMSVYIYKTWHGLNKMQKFAWAFVYAGGLSNIGERIFFGKVIDFIPIANGMLNVADFFILIGLMIFLASSRYKEKSSETSEKLS